MYDTDCKTQIVTILSPCRPSAEFITYISGVTLSMLPSQSRIFGLGCSRCHVMISSLLAGERVSLFQTVPKTVPKQGYGTVLAQFGARIWNCFETTWNTEDLARRRATGLLKCKTSLGVDQNIGGLVSQALSECSNQQRRSKIRTASSAKAHVPSA